MNKNKTRRSKVSFISEHTAEYILVPNLINKLIHVFPNIFPFYFWKSREGNAMSRWSGEDKSIHIVMVFPRRPKINIPKQKELIVKFNCCLFDAAQVASQFGIPVFAGVPLVSSIFDLSFNVDCAWFHIKPSNSKQYDIETLLRIDSVQSTELHNDETLKGPIDDQSMIDIIISNSNPMSWADSIEVIRNLAYLSTSADFFGGFRGYKPFYLAINADSIKSPNQKIHPNLIAALVNRTI